MTDSNQKLLETELEDLRAEILALSKKYAARAFAATNFDPQKSPVPVSGRVVGESEIANLVDSALDCWLTTGRFNDSFEKKLSEYLDVRHALTVNSGSSANLLAVSALTSHLLKDKALSPGDEVITCATGFPTTVNPLLQHGLIPVFVDADIPTYNISADRVREAVSDRTRAIVVAHTLGNPFDIDQIKSIAEENNLWLVEDCCDALGSTYNGQLVGTFGDIGTLSFYPAHHITMGEGGAVFTQQGVLKRALESIRDWGRDCYCAPGMDNTCKRRFDWQLGDLPRGYDHKYTYSHMGYNLKISDMQAAVGVAQFARLPNFIMARKRNFQQLYDGLKHLSDVLIMPEATLKSDPAWFGFPLTVQDGAPFTRDELIRKLESCRIATRLLFGGNLIHQPYMKGRQFRVVGDLDNSDKIMQDTFWIGVYPGLSTDAISYVIEIISKFCTNKL